MPCVLRQLLYISAVTAGNSPNDEELLNQIQRAAFGYFLEAVNPANGLVADTSRANSPCSIAVVGFALSAYPWRGARLDDASRRGRARLAARASSATATRAAAPEATGYKGFYYHFLDMRTGAPRLALASCR